MAHQVICIHLCDDSSILCPILRQVPPQALLKSKCVCSKGDNDPNIISEHHISGTKLPVIKLAVVDTYKQVVSAGVSDSGMCAAQHAAIPR